MCGSWLHTAGFKLFSCHLWYLSEVNIALALFDPSVDVTEKRCLAVIIKNVEGSEEPARCVWVPEPSGKTLADFCASQTLDFFQILELPFSFLDVDSADWEQDESFCKTQQQVSSLSVINDNAEWRVSLIQSFTTSARTKNEEQLWYLLQGVEEHRKAFPKASKTALQK